MIKQTVTMLMIAIAALGFTGIAAAQDSGNTATAAQQEARQLMQQYRQKAAKLQQIHTETLQSNPDLQAQQEAFVAMVKDAVTDQGYDIEAGRERVQSMAEKLQSGQLGDEERKAVMQDFAAERRALGQARAAALQQPEVREAGQQLQDDTLTAMKAQNPEVEQLIADMKRLRQQLQAAMQPAPAN